MKLTITQDEATLKEITLTPLQLKAIQLTGQPPEDYLVNKLERILAFAVDQAKQTIDRISPLTDGEMEDVLDALEAEKEVKDEPEKK